MSGRAVRNLAKEAAASGNDGFYLDLMDDIEIDSDVLSDDSGSEYEMTLLREMKETGNESSESSDDPHNPKPGTSTGRKRKKSKCTSNGRYEKRPSEPQNGQRHVAIDGDDQPSPTSITSRAEQQQTQLLSQTNRENHAHGSRCEPLQDDWVWVDGMSFIPSAFDFDVNNSGLTNVFTLTEDAKELDYFLLFFDDEIVDHIVRETNRYYLQMREENPNCLGRSHQLSWKPVSSNDIYMFFCIQLTMSHVKKNRIYDYWSLDEVFETPIFPKLMSRDRFLQILRCLHFSDNTQRDGNDKLGKVRPVITHLRRRYKELFTPYQDLCIDESLLLWRGRLGFRQYIPSKRHRYGIKLFVLCDVQTDYILDFIVYTGLTTDIEHEKVLGISGSVVKTFLRDYFQKYHVLYCDNWYSSPILFRYLFENKTGACGTVRADRKHIPKNLPSPPQGEMLARQSNNMGLVKWNDNKMVHLLDTVHPTHMIDTDKTTRNGEIVRKPAPVVHYNKGMRIVDKNDMLLSSVECVRKTLRWYLKLFNHMLDMSVMNAYHLYVYKTGKKVPLLDFSKDLIRQMIAKYWVDVQGVGRVGVRVSRLTARHFPSPIPPLPNTARPRRRCHVCSHTQQRLRSRQTTYFMCIECGVPLCVHPCFGEYHTLRHF